MDPEDKTSWVKVFVTVLIVIIVCFIATGLVASYRSGYWHIWN